MYDTWGSSCARSCGKGCIKKHINKLLQTEDQNSEFLHLNHTNLIYHSGPKWAAADLPKKQHDDGNTAPSGLN